jgi:hypothetical protein
MGQNQPRHAVLWIVVNFHTYAPTPMRIPATKKNSSHGNFDASSAKWAVAVSPSLLTFRKQLNLLTAPTMFPSRSLNAEAVHTSSFRIQEEDVFYHCNPPFLNPTPPS